MSLFDWSIKPKKRRNKIVIIIMGKHPYMETPKIMAT
jgi:hypothetical protein